MPEEGVELSPRAHILSDDEVLRLAELFVKQGVNKIRLTGGEPTVRRTLPSIISTLPVCAPLPSLIPRKNGSATCVRLASRLSR